MSIERKGFRPHEFKLDEAGTVTVAFAQLGVIDRDADLTERGAFPIKDVPMSAYGHTSWMGELPTGKGGIREEGDWAVFNGQFLMETDQGRNAYHTVKAMAELQEWSYGYDPIDFAFEMREGKSIRILRKLDVFEVSPVLLGAGIGTHTRAIKGAAGSQLPYAEHLSLGLEVVQAIAERSKDRAAYRAKEGRALSGANRDRLSSLADELKTAVVDLEDLLVEGDPDASPAPADHVSALLEEARFLGIPV